MSEPLLPQDPATIGGHRLLARLGAGGMGVVYLGRSPSGGLAAVKVVHPELAEEGDFRTRFRREVEAARRVASPWATPVTAAGPEETVPWLATAFVPGPSLSEAVGRFGPLPARSVRPLGAMLAAALRAVHAAGLVHRDVKPGNVLLAVDGPRLIDFGIARSADQTALTSAGVVAGSPGFLSPEQAEANTAELGPASDVFSLGCLLAYAMTGRAPFGGGTTEAVLYRTVHDEPDLAGIGTDGDGVSGGLLALLRECLGKDPAARPTAQAIELRLTDSTGTGGTWLPENVVRDIADRSARMLALPDIDPTLVSGQDGEPPARTSRRRMLGLISGAAVLTAAGGGTALWALTRDDGGAPPSDGNRWALAVHADLTGPGGATGRAQEQGARLAVEQYNARKDKPFELGLKTADDKGSAERSKSAAERLVGDREVLAVLGPTTVVTGVGALDTYDEALLPVLFVAPGGRKLFSRQCRSAVHCRAVEGAVAFQLARILADAKEISNPGILQDRTAGKYSWQVVLAVIVQLRKDGLKPYPRVIPAGLDAVGPAVKDIVDAKVDSFLYAGFAEGGAEAARHLAGTGFSGPRLGAEALVDPVFVEQAGEVAEGWLLSAPFIDPTAVPEAKSFTADFRRRFGSEPGYYAAEAYDAANLTIQELTKATKGGRPPSRSELVPLLRKSRYQGVAKPYAFNPETGEFDGDHSFMYRVEGGRFRFLGPAPSKG